MRKFSTGATRDSDTAKIDPEGFFSPIVELAFCDYMNRHRKQADGKIRESDNWQKGIPPEAYMKSLKRHVLDAWLRHRGCEPLYPEDQMKDALCAIIFNASGYLFELLKSESSKKPTSQVM